MDIFFEDLSSFQDNIERALAGYMTNKEDADLTSTDIENARRLSFSIKELNDYIALYSALDKDDDAEIERILKQYKYKKDDQMEAYNMKKTNIKEGALDAGRVPFDINRLKTLSGIAEDEMDAVYDEPVADYDAEMGPPSDGMGAEIEPEMDMDADMDTVSDMDMDTDMGMEEPMDIAPVNDVPAELPAPSLDVRTEIEDHFNNIISLSPDLKVADFKLIVDKAEEVVGQLKTMGVQYLKESEKIKNKGKTFRQIHEGMSGFKKNLMKKD